MTATSLAPARTETGCPPSAASGAAAASGTAVVPRTAAGAAKAQATLSCGNRLWARWAVEAARTLDCSVGGARRSWLPERLSAPLGLSSADYFATKSSLRLRPRALDELGGPAYSSLSPSARRAAGWAHPSSRAGSVLRKEIRGSRRCRTEAARSSSTMPAAVSTFASIWSAHRISGCSMSSRCSSIPGRGQPQSGRHRRGRGG